MGIEGQFMPWAHMWLKEVTILTAVHASAGLIRGRQVGFTSSRLCWHQETCSTYRLMINRSLLGNHALCLIVV